MADDLTEVVSLEVNTGTSVEQLEALRAKTQELSNTTAAANDNILILASRLSGLKQGTEAHTAALQALTQAQNAAVGSSLQLAAAQTALQNAGGGPPLSARLSNNFGPAAGGAGGIGAPPAGGGGAPPAGGGGNYAGGGGPPAPPGGGPIPGGQGGAGVPPAAVAGMVAAMQQYQQTVDDLIAAQIQERAVTAELTAAKTQLIIETMGMKANYGDERVSSERDVQVSRALVAEKEALLLSMQAEVAGAKLRVFANQNGGGPLPGMSDDAYYAEMLNMAVNQQHLEAKARDAAQVSQFRNRGLNDNGTSNQFPTMTSGQTEELAASNDLAQAKIQLSESTRTYRNALEADKAVALADVNVSRALVAEKEAALAGIKISNITNEMTNRTKALGTGYGMPEGLTLQQFDAQMQAMHVKRLQLEEEQNTQLQAASNIRAGLPPGGINGAPPPPGSGPPPEDPNESGGNGPASMFSGIGKVFQHMLIGMAIYQTIGQLVYGISSEVSKIADAQEKLDLASRKLAFINNTSYDQARASAVANSYDIAGTLTTPADRLSLMQEASRYSKDPATVSDITRSSANLQSISSGGTLQGNSAADIVVALVEGNKEIAKIAKDSGRSESQTLVDLLAKSFKTSNVDPDVIAKELAASQGSIAAGKFSLTEYIATLSTITQKGVPFGTSAAILRTGSENYQTPENQSKLEKVGVNVLSDPKDPNSVKPFLQVMEELRVQVDSGNISADKFNETLNAVFGPRRAAQMHTVIEALHQVSLTTTELNDNIGTYAKLQDSQMQSLTGRLAELNREWEKSLTRGNTGTFLASAADRLGSNIGRSNFQADAQTIFTQALKNGALTDPTNPNYNAYYAGMYQEQLHRPYGPVEALAYGSASNMALGRMSQQYMYERGQGNTIQQQEELNSMSSGLLRPIPKSFVIPEDVFDTMSGGHGIQAPPGIKPPRFSTTQDFQPGQYDGRRSTWTGDEADKFKAILDTVAAENKKNAESLLNDRRISSEQYRGMIQENAVSLPLGDGKFDTKEFLGGANVVSEAMKRFVGGVADLEKTVPTIFGTQMTKGAMASFQEIQSRVAADYRAQLKAGGATDAEIEEKLKPKTVLVPDTNGKLTPMPVIGETQGITSQLQSQGAASVNSGKISSDVFDNTILPLSRMYQSMLLQQPGAASNPSINMPKNIIQQDVNGSLYQRQIDSQESLTMAIERWKADVPKVMDQIIPKDQWKMVQQFTDQYTAELKKLNGGTTDLSAALVTTRDETGKWTTDLVSSLEGNTLALKSVSEMLGKLTPGFQFKNDMTSDEFDKVWLPAAKARQAQIDQILEGTPGLQKQENKITDIFTEGRGTAVQLGPEAMSAGDEAVAQLKKIEGNTAATKDFLRTVNQPIGGNRTDFGGPDTQLIRGTPATNRPPYVGPITNIPDVIDQNNKLGQPTRDKYGNFTNDTTPGAAAFELTKWPTGHDGVPRVIVDNIKDIVPGGVGGIAGAPFGTGNGNAVAAGSFFPIDEKDPARNARLRNTEMLIKKYAAEYGVDPNIIASLIGPESGGDPLAVGDGGHSVGLFQMHDNGAGKGMSVAERQDPETQFNKMMREIRDNYNAGKEKGLSGDALAEYVGRMVERPAEGNSIAYGNYYNKLTQGLPKDGTGSPTPSPVLPASGQALPPDMQEAIDAQSGANRTIVPVPSSSTGDVRPDGSILRKSMVDGKIVTEINRGDGKGWFPYSEGGASVPVPASIAVPSAVVPSAVPRPAPVGDPGSNANEVLTIQPVAPKTGSPEYWKQMQSSNFGINDSPEGKIVSSTMNLLLPMLQSMAGPGLQGALAGHKLPNGIIPASHDSMDSSKKPDISTGILGKDDVSSLLTKTEWHSKMLLDVAKLPDINSGVGELRAMWEGLLSGTARLKMDVSFPESLHVVLSGSIGGGEGAGGHTSKTNPDNPNAASSNNTSGANPYTSGGGIDASSLTAGGGGGGGVGADSVLGSSIGTRVLMSLARAMANGGAGL